MTLSCHFLVCSHSPSNSWFRSTDLLRWLGQAAIASRTSPGTSNLLQGHRETAPEEPTDPQVKAVLDQMAAAGVLHPKTLEQAQKAYLFYTKFAGPPENVFHVEDRTVPGPNGNIPIRVYVPRVGGGLPMWVFFHGGGFVGGSLDTHD